METTQRYFIIIKVIIQLITKENKHFTETITNVQYTCAVGVLHFFSGILDCLISYLKIGHLNQTATAQHTHTTHTQKAQNNFKLLLNVTLSAKTCIVHTASKFFFPALFTMFKEWVLKISAESSK